MIHFSIYFGPVRPHSNCVVILRRDLFGILPFIYSDIFSNFADFGYLSPWLMEAKKKKKRL